MGFIKAFSGAIGGTFADQWVDFYKPRTDISATAAVFSAVPKSQNNGRGENYKGSENIISNGSKIVVPEGTALDYGKWSNYWFNCRTWWIWI